jgi:hypothetical protein
VSLCSIACLRHRICVDIFVRRREVGTGKAARHGVTGEVFIDTTPRRPTGPSCKSKYQPKRAQMLTGKLTTNPVDMGGD